jgi:DnaA regulatory inactivator Hda
MTRAQQLLLDLSRKPNYSEMDYVESPCNWEAAQWIRRWPDWPMKMIAIYGEPGCGKTHLAHIWQGKTGARFLTLNDIPDLPPHDALGEASAIVLDDADALFQKEASPADATLRENWMFHFYNLVKEKGADLLLCSLQPPTQWTVTLPDLRSRLATILSIAVNPPDEEALKAVLFKLCSERGMTLSVEVGEYILRRVERSFDRVRSLVAALDHHALSQHRQLTLGLVREVLTEI